MPLTEPVGLALDPNDADTDNDGRYDTLEVETRNIRTPRLFDQTGLPTANDNEAVIKENPDLYGKLKYKSAV